jgi:hypothetical protein
MLIKKRQLRQIFHLRGSYATDEETNERMLHLKYPLLFSDSQQNYGDKLNCSKTSQYKI